MERNKKKIKKPKNSIESSLMSITTIAIIAMYSTSTLFGPTNKIVLIFIEKKTKN